MNEFNLALNTFMNVISPYINTFMNEFNILTATQRMLRHTIYEPHRRIGAISPVIAATGRARQLFLLNYRAERN